MISAVRVGQAAGSERRRTYDRSPPIVDDTGRSASELSAPARSTLSAGARYAVDAGSAAGRLLEYDVRFSLRPCQSGKHGKRSSKQLHRSDGRGAANRPGAAMRARRCVRTVHRAFVERAGRQLAVLGERSMAFGCRSTRPLALASGVSRLSRLVCPHAVRCSGRLSRVVPLLSLSSALE